MVTLRGGFTVAWFVVIFGNLTKSLSQGLPYLEILKGWLKDSIFTRQHKMARELLSYLLVNQKRTLKEFWILILQYNNSLRAPRKRCAKLEPKSKHWSKESWIQPNCHKSRLIENSINLYITKISTGRDHNAFIFSTMIWFFAKGKLLFVAFLSIIHPPYNTPPTPLPHPFPIHY